MNQHLKLVCGTFLLCLAGCIGASSNNRVTPTLNGTGMALPSLVVDDLEGVAHRFPEELKGRMTAIVFAFKHEQQEAVNPWMDGLDALAVRYPKLRVLEMPTIESSTAAFRAMVNNGMRSGIKDPKARARTLTLFVNKGEFLKSLGIVDESVVHPILFNEDGALVWRSSGAYAPEKLADLEKLLERTTD